MHSSPSLPLATQQELHTLLSHRLAVISDKKLRDENPARHLDELKKASEGIDQWLANHRAQLPPKLNHYLTQASFQKALDWLEGHEAPH